MKVLSRLSYRDGHIDLDQMEILSNLYNAKFLEYIKPRNLTIYLRAAPEITHARMVRRCRATEVGYVSLDKVKSLSLFHDEEYLNNSFFIVIDESEFYECISSKAV